MENKNVKEIKEKFNKLKYDDQWDLLRELSNSLRYSSINLVDENIFRFNLETLFCFGISKYTCPDNFHTSTIILKNKYIDYKMVGENILNEEILLLIETIKKLENDKLDNVEETLFYEQDIKFLFIPNGDYSSVKGWIPAEDDLGEKIYNEKFAVIIFHLENYGLGYSGEHYSIMVDMVELIRFRKYLEKIIK